MQIVRLGGVGMYLDHRITVKIARILDMVDLSALLLDAEGNVILPEGDQRVFTMPEELMQNPTMPFVYGAMTLIGTGEEQPVYVCLHGDSEDIKKCAVLCAELINLLLREDMSQTNREQAIRMMLRGEVEGAEFESLAAEHEIPMQKNRCVLYFYFQDMEVEPAIQPDERHPDRRRGHDHRGGTPLRGHAQVRGRGGRHGGGRGVRPGL